MNYLLKISHLVRLVVSMCTFALSHLLSAQDFYYSFGEKIPVSKVVDKFLVLKNQNISVATILSNASVQPLTTTTLSNNNYAAMIHVVSGNDIVGTQTKLSTQSSVKQVMPVIKTAAGGEMGLTDKIVVKFKTTTNQTQINSLATSNGLTLVSNANNRSVYTVSNPSNVLAIANTVYETGLSDYAHPDFFVLTQRNAYIPNDPYFNKQFHLHNTGQVINDGHTCTPDADVDAPEAWDITKGSSSIVVAVIDEGVTSNHPDLPNTRQIRLNGSNFNAPYDGTSPNDPSPTLNGNHGNACAGIVAASQDNGEGVTGIAPNCKIMPIRFPFDGGTITDIANIFYFATNNGAHIMSNSWSLNPTQGGYFTPNSFPDIITSIQYAINNNRVVLFAAGNTANAVAGNQGFVSYPSNINIPTLITVGASDRYDKRANYSPLSNLSSSNNQVVDIVAPSHREYPSQISNETLEIWSIDIPGTAGYNPWNDAGWGLPAVGENLPSSGTNYQSYTGRMGGTSAATPLTAGIAALLLSANPSLTNQQVFDLLTCSADDVGGYTYTSGYSNEMGHGRVNAFNALMSMCISSINITWPISNPNGIKYQAGQYLKETSTVTSTSKVSLKAGNSITFDVGTNLNYGSVVNTTITPCLSCVQNSSLRIDNSNDTATQTLQQEVETLESTLAYPNPISSGFLNFSKTADNFKLINTSGVEVLNGKNVDQINTDGLAKGLYLLHIDGKAMKVVIE